MKPPVTWIKETCRPFPRLGEGDHRWIHHEEGILDRLTEKELRQLAEQFMIRHPQQFQQELVFIQRSRDRRAAV